MEEHGKVREAEMRMRVVNCKRGMSLPDGSWRECEDKHGAEKKGLHGHLREVKVQTILKVQAEVGKFLRFALPNNFPA